MRLSYEFDRQVGTGGSAYPAPNAPLLINYRIITLHPDDLYRADFHTLSASGASILIGFAEKIGGHQDISWYLFPPDRPHGPATAATAVAGMFDSFSRIIDKMNKAGLF